MLCSSHCAITHLPFHTFQEANPHYFATAIAATTTMLSPSCLVDAGHGSRPPTRAPQPGLQQSLATCTTRQSPRTPSNEDDSSVPRTTPTSPGQIALKPQVSPLGFAYLDKSVLSSRIIQTTCSRACLPR
ncbi:hypothetical protein ACN47E_005066 [Coniothyrium glycines]